jgi:predicted HTH transcriptional regulator
VADGKSIVIFEVPKAAHTPVRFRETEFIRVGTYKKKLKEYPEKERELWGSLERVPFEKGMAARSLSPDEVLKLIDYPAYFELTKQNLPDGRGGILDRLVSERLVARDGDDRFHITNLGAILFGKTLARFDGLARKAVRVVVYQGRNRVDTLREDPGGTGYAAGFENLIRFINSQLPQNEHIGRALRAEVRMYPELAIRELVANALIHQDFWMTGTGPLVEIFTDRIEITNPGTPLIDPMRFIDQPPQSRNEDLASFMRRVNICEERGSGIDKVIFHVEMFQLPAPDFSVTEKHTRAVLFAHRRLGEMTPQDRIRACYQHAGLQWVSNEQMTNTSLRRRFGITDQNSAQASRIIRDTLEAGLIKESDPTNMSRRHSRYVPYWA